MKYSTLFASAFCVIATMTSCNAAKQIISKPSQAVTETVAAVTPAAKPVAKPAALPFEGEWAIVEVAGKPVAINGEDHPKITFEAVEGAPAEVAVIGFNGCNYINGTWSVQGKTVTKQGEFLSSLRSCPDAPYETAINHALDRVATFVKTDAKNISLLAADGSAAMKLRKTTTSFLNGAWKVTAINGQKVPAEADIRIVIDTDNCKLHGNAGCNMLNGEITVNLDKPDAIEFKNLATTRMTCPFIATEQSFLVALESVDTAVKSAGGAEAVLKDNAGNTVITMRRLSNEEVAQ